ncbi:carbohydrate ABC transporter permease [Microbacterium sp. H1-D42]|uniref:carbohydrate ABC transporter permease n=1 Tax=Microbacterium sp. H1-D42 TaxID=2925844 RepID=UPI001F534A50|nr:carbohydrate ABC transporter permease [Microbacterium sp. H1-D42]UNK70226.1 carbohydrate ABC transporter permease [Microbacterium sp. H1-D42]
MKDASTPSRVLIYIALGFVALLQLLPFYFGITTAAKPKSDLSSPWTLPSDIYWQNFATALEQGQILTAIGNSAIVTVISTVLVCVLGALTAYPLARRITRGNQLVYAGIIALIMIPPLSVLVPLYTLMKGIGGLNTHWGIILVMVTGNLPLAVFLYTAFMRSLPISIEEAATVDGANSLQVLFRVVFPMLKPVTATVAILAGVAIWNEFALSTYFLREPATRTIAPAVANFFASQGSNPGAAAAASLLSVVPVLLAYLFLQRNFIKGMVAGAMK